MTKKPTEVARMEPNKRTRKRKKIDNREKKATPSEKPKEKEQGRQRRNYWKC